MKTLFSVGFQSNNPFTVRHPSLTGAPSLGRSMALRQAPVMGQASSEFEHVADADAQANADMRDKLSAIIAQGTPKAAQVRRWIAGVAAKDPSLLSVFKDQYVVDNWHGYEDIINKDQASVDMASQKIASSDPVNWEFSDDMAQRVQEWNQVLDIMVAGMKEYGGASAPAIKPGPIITITTKTGAPVVTSIAPGAKLTTKPPSSGLSTNTLLIGGLGAAALVGLAYALTA
jgi:hypothetical protein